jgi:hypothetical protein
MSTPKVIPTVPTLDDTPKEPRIKPKRCPRCGSANRPDAPKCTTCKYDFAGPPPPPGKMKARAAAKSGGGAGKAILLVVVIAALGTGGAVYYFGVDKAVAWAQTFYKKAPAPVSPQVAAQNAAREAVRKQINALKAEQSTCFSQFNDLMDKKHPPSDQNALLQSYQNHTRQLAAVTPFTVGCGPDVVDPQKVESCDAANQLRTCLSTVMTMEREHLNVKP